MAFGLHFAVQFSGAEAGQHFADARPPRDAEGDDVVAAKDGADVAGVAEVL